MQELHCNNAGGEGAQGEGGCGDVDMIPIQKLGRASGTDLFDTPTTRNQVMNYVCAIAQN